MLRSTCLVAVLAIAPPARAQDAFEVQVYDSETAPRGEPGLELHVNQHVITGAPDETHATLEPHYELTDWAELGGYLQGSVSTTGDVSYAGVKLRLKVRWPHKLWEERVGLAINGEVSAVPARFEPNVWGSEVRPIVDMSIGRFYASVNPILATDLSGSLAGHPQFEPAVKVAVRARARVALGLEGYGGFGPLDDLGSEHVTRLFGVIDLAGASWDLNVGAGYGWGSPDHIVAKMIFGIHPSHG